MSATYACFDHRKIARFSLHLGGSHHCPVDGADMTFIGTRWRAPRFDDDAGWVAMAQMVSRRQLERERWNEHKTEGQRQLRMMYAANELLEKWK